MRESTSRNKGRSKSAMKWGICGRDLSGGERGQEGEELLWDESEGVSEKSDWEGVGAEQLLASDLYLKRGQFLQQSEK